MKRTKHTAQFKFNCVKETIENNNVAEVARKYKLNPDMISRWRAEFLKKGSAIFTSLPDKDTVKLRKKIAQLEQLVGKKETELALMKNFFDFYESASGTK